MCVLLEIPGKCILTNHACSAQLGSKLCELDNSAGGGTVRKNVGKKQEKIFCAALKGYLQTPNREAQAYTKKANIMLVSVFIF